MGAQRKFEDLCGTIDSFVAPFRANIVTVPTTQFARRTQRQTRRQVPMPAMMTHVVTNHLNDHSNSSDPVIASRLDSQPDSRTPSMAKKKKKKEQNVNQCWEAGVWLTTRVHPGTRSRGFDVAGWTAGVFDKARVAEVVVVVCSGELTLRAKATGFAFRGGGWGRSRVAPQACRHRAVNDF